MKLAWLCALLALFKSSKSFDVDLKWGITFPKPCSKDLDFVILIHSAPKNVELRKILRKTWTDGYKRVFFIGRSSFDIEIGQEAKEYGDIFFYDSKDSYFNMTTKVRH